jgi:hypothetical protein
MEFLRFEKDVCTPQDLLKRVKQCSEATRAAILDYDTAWFGEMIKVDWIDEQTDLNLWIHAKLYLLGNNQPIALVYRIDVEGEDEDPEESED